MNVIPSPHCRRRNNALTGVLAAVLSAVLAALVLTSPPTVATTKAKRVKYTATIDIQITLTRVAAKTASGNATFTGQLSSGAPINGNRHRHPRRHPHRHGISSHGERNDPLQRDSYPL